MNLNKLKEEVYQIAIEHGWHDEEYTDKHWLCLVIAELMEAVEADRIEKYADKAKFKEWQGNSIPLTEETRLRRFKEDFEAYIKDTVQDELADACIRLLDFAGVTDADLNDIDYENSSTEDYSELTFTESMFKIVKSINNYWEPMDIGFILNEIFAFCHSRDIDIEWHILQKMEYNRHRPYKHGDKIY